jgi:hypothetical protein
LDARSGDKAVLMRESRHDSLKRLEPELWEIISRLMYKVQTYGFQTDMDEMFWLTGVTLLICRHELPRASHKDLLGDTLVMEMYSLSFVKRRKLIDKITRLYESYLQKRRYEREKSASKVAKGYSRSSSQKALVDVGHHRRRRRAR